MAEKRKRGRPKKNTTKIEVDKSIEKDIKQFLSIYNKKYYGFNVLNESISISAQNLSSSIFSNINDNNNIINITSIKNALKRFPELEYLIDLFASATMFNAASSSGINIYIIFEDSSDSTNEKVRELKESIFTDIKFEILDLLQDNDAPEQLYNAAKQIPMYGFCYAYLNKTYDILKIFSPEDVIVDTKDNTDTLKSAKDKKTKKIKSELDIFEFYNASTGERLDKNRLFILSNGAGLFGKSLIAKILHYLKILDLLEISLLIERLSKSKNLNIWKLNTKDIPDEEDIQAILTVYKSSILSKSNIEQDSNLEAIKSSLLKTLIDNHVILPVEGKDFLEIETIKNEYKPILEDINYYQEKIYFSLGIPLYYRNVDLKNVSNIAMAMHEESFASKIRFFQNILNKFLTNWIELYISSKYNVKIKYIDISISEYIPASKRKETDADKAKKMLDVFTQLSTLLGIQLKQEFILSELFPDKNPEDILEALPEETTSSETDNLNTEEPYLFSMFMKQESSKLNKKMLKKKKYFEIKAKFKF